MDHSWSGGLEMTAQHLAGERAKSYFDDAKLRSACTDEEPLIPVATILFVEDEAFVREVTFEVLQSAGYRVRTARNAAEAMRIYDEYGAEFDLLLTDVILPGETGFVLVAKIRQENPELSVLFVTGYAEQMATARERDGEQCLAKPFSSAALLQRVKCLLDRPRVQTRRANQQMPAFADA
jgi:DNA-binding response OmpR family regulator